MYFVKSQEQKTHKINSSFCRFSFIVAIFYLILYVVIQKTGKPIIYERM